MELQGFEAVLVSQRLRTGFETPTDSDWTNLEGIRFTLELQNLSRSKRSSSIVP